MAACWPLLAAAALLALGPLAASAAEARTCPDLPPLPAGTEVIRLSAATYNATPFQTLAYNGTKWGPLLKLQLGSLYQVEVYNVDIEEGTSVHWHGQHLPNASWADGVAPLVQKPTPPGATFLARFTAGPAGAARRNREGRHSRGPRAAAAAA